MGNFVNLNSPDGFTLPVFVARPTGAPRGAVVVLQEIFGVNDHIRAVTERYAAEGYLAVAPATFARVQPDVELGYTDADMATGMTLKTRVENRPGAGVLSDVQTAIEYAALEAGGSVGAAKVGIVGFCWGGLLAWRAACELRGLAAAVCYYGGGMTNEAESARKPGCPVLAHFGKRDHFISESSVHTFAKAQTGVQVHLYDADHGFNCDQRGSYDQPAADQARERTHAFFAEHLR